jgi:type VI secretion system secreted protein Hcp
MAVDVFLLIGDIKGESKDSKHEGEIDVLSWSWGLSNPVTGQTGGGLGAGKANFSDISFMHAVDKASAALMTACAMGNHYDTATLVSRKAGKGQQEYMIVKMKEVFVTSVQQSGSSEHPTESVSLAFSHVDLEYKPQKADGSLDAGVHFMYDLKARKDS